MADFSKWIIATEEALPLEKGTFMKIMHNLRSKIVEEALEADPAAAAILMLMENRNN